MPRTRSLSWAELRIGVVTIVGVAITAITIFMLTGDRGFFWQRYNLKTRFTNVAGLRPGSPVRVAGFDVGTVDRVEFVGEEVEITMQVNQSMQQRITTESTAYLGSVSLLGESAVDINPSTAGTPIEEWGYIRQGGSRGQIADVAESATRGVEEITRLVEDLRGGKGTMGRLVTDDALYVELQRFVSTAGDLAESLKAGDGSLGRLINDPKTAESLEASLVNIETLTRRISDGEGSLGKLIADDSFSQSLTSATANLDTLVGRLNRGEGTAGRLLTDDALVNRLTSVVERMDLLTERLNAGEGTAGQLLKDQELYENMNGAVRDLRMLVADIRRDPRKYLNVRVSIF
jgi:phospholipid/cholesterol/gamma-HCH transport system substrate-binding protein